MKKAFFLLAALLPLSGCVPTVYHKSVTVTKDAQGTIEGIVIVEQVTQSADEPLRDFNYLDE